MVERAHLWSLEIRSDLQNAPKLVNIFLMDSQNSRQEVRRLLSDMLAIVDSSPDALESRYAEMRDGSYSLALQVRLAALPDPTECREFYVSEVTGRKW